MSEWKTSACILCECNCGIEVQLGGEGGREIVRIRGDKAHPASAGYLCQKASGLNYYQNGKDRLTSPLRRRPDGSFEAIAWDTAIREISERLLSIRDREGGEKIFYYGGGGQGNHLPGGYATGIRRLLGMKYRSNALAQEKTGEFWVNGMMFGNHVKGDFEHCEVAVFIGKNPWHSHGLPRARAWLRDFSKDPARKLVVIDPVVTETAEFADIHLRVRPGTDAWLLAAMVGMLVQQEKYAQAWLAQHASGLEAIVAAFDEVPVAEYCAIAGLPLEQVQQAVDVISGAASVAVAEDLGIQMNRHSTLASYLEKLVWALCGQFGHPGGQFIPASLQNIAGSGRASRRSPVAGAPIISGLVPCNVIAGEILSDHPDRYRAMVIEAANPVHSLADSRRFAQALRSLDTVVVIDVAMTETAREADYVLPAATQYEKWEATFFNFEFPDNYFQLRKPLFEAPDFALPEAEIHARLVEAMGGMPAQLCAELTAALAEGGRPAYRARFMQALAEEPGLADLAPVILYRTLGPGLPEGAAAAALLWPVALGFAMREPEALARAGFDGEPMERGEALFDAILAQHSGLVFARDEHSASWARLGNEGRVCLAIPELLAELEVLAAGAAELASGDYPLLLMAGERRDYSANTIYRDAGWRRKDAGGALRMSPEDAAQLGLSSGDRARITTRVGSALTEVVVTPRMQAGHISLPNGFGLDNEDGARRGVAVNELTSLEERDRFAGTPHHKIVPARVEAVA
ncbi:MAG: molybdopterin-dependent oxidoreductase [Pseudomonadales bacterium]|nr:molybdopterin-dependent oxidoreductase [Pseudomonadales bacterium]